MSVQKPCILCVSGSDSLGGAGIQSDIKVAVATGSYATTVITVITAQNTQEVTERFPLPANIVAAQMEAIFSDLTIKAVKIGMCYNSEIMLVVADKLKKWNAKNIIIDPVMYGTLGRQLINNNAVSTLQAALLPLADLITPNMTEASRLFGIKINSFSDIENAAQMLGEKYNSDVLLKNINAAAEPGTDLYYDHKSKKSERLLSAPIDTKNTHGSGSSLSTAIASFLSADYSMKDAVDQARAYINLAIAGSAKWNLGKGTGPLDHLFSYTPFLKE